MSFNSVRSSARTASTAPVVGYAPGVFDMFHVGHLNILRNAKRACDVLIVGCVSDEMAQLAKGKAPIIPVTERMEIVGAIDVVDRVVVEDVPSKVEMWQRLHFDVIVKGDDWRGTEKGDRLERDFAPLGVEVVYQPYTMHTSSTLLRAALNLRTADAEAVAGG